MKFGVNTFIWSESLMHPISVCCPRSKRQGSTGLRFLVAAAGASVSGHSPAVEANGLECNCCTVLVDGLSLISDSPDIRRRTRQHLEEVAKAAAEAGAKIVAGPLYSPVGYLPGRRRTGDEWKWAVEGFQAVGDTLAACQVTFAIEPLNRFETYFLNTAADAAQLAKEIGHPNIGILFDTFHANIEEKNIAAVTVRLGFT